MAGLWLGRRESTGCGCPEEGLLWGVVLLLQEGLTENEKKVGGESLKCSRVTGHMVQSERLLVKWAPAMHVGRCWVSTVSAETGSLWRKGLVLLLAASVAPALHSDSWLHPGAQAGRA